jgi:hypothetical protein
MSRTSPDSGPLLPCPFCGGEAQAGFCYVGESRSEGQSAVRCLSCSCRATMKDWQSRGVAPTGQQRIAAPGNDQLSKLWNAIVENTKGDGFWIGEILLTTLEREVGFNPTALTDTSTLGNSK